MAPAATTERSTWSSNQPSHAILSATYTNASGSIPSNHQFSYPISSPIPAIDSAVADKTTYLSELRTSIKTLQEQINVFLTQKMEEGKLQPVTDKDSVPLKKAERKTTDEEEEENYGEEGVEEGEQG
jgi:hypothetical protein